MELQNKYKKCMEPSNSILRNKDISSILIRESKITNPRISIMIPTYKRPQLLLEAIQSALNQEEYEDYEIIVVDNEAKLDKVTETQKIINSVDSNRLGYYKNSENIGMFGNWNRCFELARSPWVCLLHDDDLLASDYLKTVNKLINDKHMAITIQTVIINSYEDINKKSINKNPIKNLFRNKAICRNMCDYLYNHNVTFCLYYRENVIELGGFNEEYYPNSDYVFISLYNKFFGTYYIHKPLAYYRIMENESFKDEVTKGFIIGDYYLHKEIINLYRSKILKFLLGKFNITKAYFYTYELNKDWNKEISFSEIKNKLNIKQEIKISDKVIYQLVFYFIKIKIYIKLLLGRKLL